MKNLTCLALALLLVASPLVSAQPVNGKAPTGPIETRLEQRKVTVGADGKEALVPAEAVKPGDVIEYTAIYRNTGKQPVRSLEATLPIPPNTEFVVGSIRPAGAKASTDGAAFANLPLKRRVTRDGKQVEEEVPTREYRALRWFPGELGADKSVSYTARVKVNDDRAPSTPGSKGGAK